MEKLLALNLVGLPESFIQLFRSPNLINRIRCCRDGFFHLDTVAVDIKGGHGKLIRFFSDSQDCAHWSLYLSPDGQSHAVAATYHFSGSRPSLEKYYPAHPKDIMIVADSFEEFIYRFWLENEIFAALIGRNEMPPGGEEYLSHYRKL